jgi:hypothetical protein
VTIQTNFEVVGALVVCVWAETAVLGAVVAEVKEAALAVVESIVEVVESAAEVEASVEGWVTVVETALFWVVC